MKDIDNSLSLLEYRKLHKTFYSKGGEMELVYFFILVGACGLVTGIWFSGYRSGYQEGVRDTHRKRDRRTLLLD